MQMVQTAQGSHLPGKILLLLTINASTWAMAAILTPGKALSNSLFPVSKDYSL